MSAWRPIEFPRNPFVAALTLSGIILGIYYFAAWLESMQ